MPHRKILLSRPEQIIKAAESLFMLQSFEKTTMQQISQEAGIPRATIYLEFPGGKEDILVASLKSHLEGLLAEMRVRAKASKQSRIETLKQSILFYLVEAYNRSTHVQYDPNNIERHSKRIREEMGEFFEARAQFFKELLNQAKLTQEISEESDTQRFAEILNCSLRSFLPPYNARMTKAQLERDAQDLYTLLLQAMRRT